MKKHNGFLVLVGLVGVVWLMTVIGGFFVLAKEAYTPVAKSEVAADFPVDSKVRLAAGKSTLVIFFHPQCPCSRASLRELDEVLGETQGKLAVVAVFTVPAGEPSGWEKTDLWNSASAMPGVAVLRDGDGQEARRFGVKGSGHALLYSPEGRLLFSGGITASRGHEGDNDGHTAIVDFVMQGSSSVTRTPVFGCSLL